MQPDCVSCVGAGLDLEKEQHKGHIKFNADLHDYTELNNLRKRWACSSFPAGSRWHGVFNVGFTWWSSGWFGDPKAGHIANGCDRNHEEYIDQVCDYFGDTNLLLVRCLIVCELNIEVASDWLWCSGQQIAFYFAFLGFYTKMIWPLAIAVVPIYVWQLFVSHAHRSIVQLTG